LAVSRVAPACWFEEMSWMPGYFASASVKPFSRCSVLKTPSW
jgi:hypothetical protein